MSADIADHWRSPGWHGCHEPFPRADDCHSGACTFHADSPREAARRLATVMGTDAGIRPHEVNQMISDAIDLLVQIGIRNEVRRVVSISRIAKNLKNGDVFFELIYRFQEESFSAQPELRKAEKLL